MEKKKKFQIPTTALVYHAYDRMRGPDRIIPAGCYETEKVGNMNKVLPGRIM